MTEEEKLLLENWSNELYWKLCKIGAAAGREPSFSNPLDFANYVGCELEEFIEKLLTAQRKRDAEIVEVPESFTREYEIKNNILNQK